MGKVLRIGWLLMEILFAVLALWFAFDMARYMLHTSACERQGTCIVTK